LRLISYFQVLSDSLFTQLAPFGISSRDQMMISKTGRDAAPLNCNGEAFESTGSVNNWIELQ
jgi:hypothetical protein